MLIALLGDHEATVRLTAADALGKIGNQKAEPFLIQVLHDSDPMVREAAARSVGRLPGISVEAGTELVALLRDPAISVRHAAAQALGAGESTPLLVSALVGLLTDPDPAIRQAAGHALLLVDAHDAYVALSKGTIDVDPAVRQWTVAALGESGDARAVPVLLARLRHDSVAGVRAEAAYRLRFVGDGSMAPDLETIIQRESSHDVKRWAGKTRMDSGRGSTPIQRLD
jgi:HEAT repeat protein